jgi:hypothetical protein
MLHRFTESFDYRYRIHLLPEQMARVDIRTYSWAHRLTQTKQSRDVVDQMHRVKLHCDPFNPVLKSKGTDFSPELNRLSPMPL